MKEDKTKSISTRATKRPESKPARRPTPALAAASEPAARSEADAARRLVVTLANLADGFVLLDRDWRYIFVNAAAARLLNRPAAELLGHVVWDLFPTAAASPIYAHFHRAVAENVPVQFEHAEPGRGWFEMRCQPTSEGLAVYFSDITPRKQAEAALRENEECLRLAVETAGLGFYARNLAGNEVTVNAQFRSIMGLPPEGGLDPDLAPKSLYPEDRERVLTIVARAFNPRLREIAAAEFRIIRPDGQVRWVSGRGRVVFDDAGPQPRPVRFMGVLLDITEDKQVEEALRASEARFRLLAEAVPDLIWSARADGFSDYYNTQFLEYLGKTAAEMQGWTWVSTLHPDDRERGARAWRAALETGNEYCIEFRIRRAADGAYRWFLSRALPLRDREGQAIRWYGIVSEIHDRKLAAETAERRSAELTRANAELEAKVRERTARLQEMIAELEQMSYSIMHDLRAPLRAMNSFTELILAESGTALSERGKDFLQRIIAASRRMDELLRDALCYNQAVRRRLPLAPVEAGALLADILASYPQFQAPRAEIRLEGRIPPVLGNEAALTQCFSHLLDNAVKFVSPGTTPRVKIRAEVRQARNPPPSDSSDQSDSSDISTLTHHASRITHHGPRTTPPSPSPISLVRLWFQDNGIGVPEDCRQKIFDMFQQIEAHQGGTGIGLALVRKLVERMGGQVGVESGPGPGSRFWLELRVAD